MKMKRAKFLVVLDTMWGVSPGRAPAWFIINPWNHSGRRLYKLTEARVGELWVTNACPLRTDHAKRHGMPNPEWLHHNLWNMPLHCRRLPLLVCGKVAEQTYRESGYKHLGTVMFMAHPAARNWTRLRLLKAQRIIKKHAGGR